MTWAVAEAKSKFSEVLDNAETQGPQRIQRRKKRYVLLTEEQYTEHRRLTEKPEAFVSAWDALAPSFEGRYDVDFARLGGKMRKADLG